MARFFFSRKPRSGLDQSGQLRQALDTAPQRRLVQNFLEEKAVAGHNCYRVSKDFTAQETCALQKLVQGGWIQEYTCQDLPDAPAWQLTPQTLEKIRIHMQLQFPYNVFTRREHVALEHATHFELLLALKSQGFQEKSAEKVRKKKIHPPFTSGPFAARSCQSLLVKSCQGLGLALH